MKASLWRVFFYLCFLPFLYLLSRAQNDQVILPNGFAPGEEALLPSYLFQVQNRPRNAITTPPGGSLRNMAEWEEIQALLITWTAYPSILAEIVRTARQHTTVLIHCSDSNQVKNYLNNQGIPLSNVKFLEVPYNSIWIRDYGPNSVYRNDVDSLLLVDWIYNRPRPADDAMPEEDAAYFGLPLYETTAPPTDLVYTGGNWMTDGRGTGFSSRLFLEDNGPGNNFGVTVKDTQDVKQILQAFMGIQRFVHMQVLPYDGIHHIDMHMKLLDEETLLVGLYPTGISDGPQIEANLSYILDHFQTVFGTPYKIVRIPMPPSPSGNWPSGGASYRTYTNSVFVNGAIIVPSYREEYDTIAHRIYREQLPGYEIKFIDCDNSGANIISNGGAIHCITNAVGVKHPLWISHKKLEDAYEGSGPFQVNALIKHRSGIQSATVYWRTDTTQPYQSAPMTLSNPSQNIWTGYIPDQPGDTYVYYYIQAQANSGKVQRRPIVAPAGWWRFKVLKSPNTGLINECFEKGAFPNPAQNLVCIPVHAFAEMQGRLELMDLQGRLVRLIHKGSFPQGQYRYYTDVSDLVPGTYILRLLTERGEARQKLIVTKQ
ncbi:MAG: agmatine deiminase family protein [Flavobacteriales bacterium]|nr:agmatine deiminase family protein [Flavobacteriales bacterium]MDW8409456.1 agmatine deiminase family protein [Flavobacteriales bacterium]